MCVFNISRFNFTSGDLRKCFRKMKWGIGLRRKIWLSNQSYFYLLRLRRKLLKTTHTEERSVLYKFNDRPGSKTNHLDIATYIIMDFFSTPSYKVDIS